MVRMSDVGVGAEADYYEKARNGFRSFFVVITGPR